MEGNGLVAEFVMGRVEERYCAVLLFNFFELLDEYGVLPQLCAVAFLKFGPALGIVTEPFSKLVCGRDIFQPEVETSLIF